MTKSDNKTQKKYLLLFFMYIVGLPNKYIFIFYYLNETFLNQGNKPQYSGCSQIEYIFWTDNH